jgi:transcriptional regulator with XRE-family HTH domain
MRTNLEGQESIMTTQFGKELKKLRIDIGMTLMDMAKVIGVSAAFLSAIETGRKRIPDDLLETLAEKFPQVQAQRDKFEAVINQTRSEVRVPLGNGTYEDALLATALARRFSSMSAEEKERLRSFMME